MKPILSSFSQSSSSGRSSTPRSSNAPIHTMRGSHWLQFRLFYKRMHERWSRSGGFMQMGSWKILLAVFVLVNLAVVFHLVPRFGHAAQSVSLGSWSPKDALLLDKLESQIKTDDMLARTRWDHLESAAMRCSDAEDDLQKEMLQRSQAILRELELSGKRRNKQTSVTEPGSQNQSGVLSYLASWVRGLSLSIPRSPNSNANMKDSGTSSTSGSTPFHSPSTSRQQYHPSYVSAALTAQLESMMRVPDTCWSSLHVRSALFTQSASSLYNNIQHKRQLQCARDLPVAHSLSPCLSLALAPSVLPPPDKGLALALLRLFNRQSVIEIGAGAGLYGLLFAELSLESAVATAVNRATGADPFGYSNTYATATYNKMKSERQSGTERKDKRKGRRSRKRKRKDGRQFHPSDVYHAVDYTMHSGLLTLRWRGIDPIPNMPTLASNKMDYKFPSHLSSESLNPTPGLSGVTTSSSTESPSNPLVSTISLVDLNTQSGRAHLLNLPDPFHSTPLVRKSTSTTSTSTTSSPNHNQDTIPSSPSIPSSPVTIQSPLDSSPTSDTRQHQQASTSHPPSPSASPQITSSSHISPYLERRGFSPSLARVVRRVLSRWSSLLRLTPSAILGRASFCSKRRHPSDKLYRKMKQYQQGIAVEEDDDCADDDDDDNDGTIPKNIVRDGRLNSRSIAATDQGNQPTSASASASSSSSSSSLSKAARRPPSELRRSIRREVVRVMATLLSSYTGTDPITQELNRGTGNILSPLTSGVGKDPVYKNDYSSSSTTSPTANEAFSILERHVRSAKTSIYEPLTSSLVAYVMTSPQSSRMKLLPAEQPLNAPATTYYPPYDPSYLVVSPPESPSNPSTDQAMSSPVHKDISSAITNLYEEGLEWQWPSRSLLSYSLQAVPSLWSGFERVHTPAHASHTPHVMNPLSSSSLDPIESDTSTSGSESTSLDPQHDPFISGPTQQSKGQPLTTRKGTNNDRNKPKTSDNVSAQWRTSVSSPVVHPYPAPLEPTPFEQPSKQNTLGSSQSRNDYLKYSLPDLDSSVVRDERLEQYISKVASSSPRDTLIHQSGLPSQSSMSSTSPSPDTTLPSSPSPSPLKSPATWLASAASLLPTHPIFDWGLSLWTGARIPISQQQLLLAALCSNSLKGFVIAWSPDQHCSSDYAAFFGEPITARGTPSTPSSGPSSSGSSTTLASIPMTRCLSPDDVERLVASTHECNGQWTTKGQTLQDYLLTTTPKTGSTSADAEIPTSSSTTLSSSNPTTSHSITEQQQRLRQHHMRRRMSRSSPNPAPRSPPPGTMADLAGVDEVSEPSGSSPRNSFTQPITHHARRFVRMHGLESSLRASAHTNAAKQNVLVFQAVPIQ